MAAKMFLMFALKLLTDCYRSNGHGNKKDKGCENIFEHLQVVTNTFNKKFIFQVKTNHIIMYFALSILSSNRPANPLLHDSLRLTVPHNFSF